MKNRLLAIVVLSILVLSLALPGGYADVIVKETRTSVSGWGTPDTPIGDFFYLVGDVVSFPFDLLGNLF